jgi:hypothetical protein
MSHHRHRELNNLNEYVESKPGEKLESYSPKAPHPFFQENDLMLLSVISPFLSQNGQKIISFFVNFGKESPATAPQGADIAGLFMQMLKNTDPAFLQNLVPLFLNAAGNSTAGEVIQRFFPKDSQAGSPTPGEN